MTAYRRRPPTCRAVQWDGSAESTEEVRRFLEETAGRTLHASKEPARLVIRDSNGRLALSPFEGSWIVADDDSPVIATYTDGDFRDAYVEA